MLEHYTKVSGRQVDDIDYYVVLAKWKLAVVLRRASSARAATRSCRPSAQWCSS